MEAAAAGRLLVVSANDGYSEAVEGMPFVLKAKPMDSYDLARQIKVASEIGEEEKRAFGKLNADHVRRTFGWDVTTDRLDNFFEESLKNHGGVDWSKWEELHKSKPQMSASGIVYRKK
jgi:glycosyltransferase involved in cell wall biosynthesis